MLDESPAPKFDRVALIGIGLINSSLAHAMRRHGMAGHIVVGDSNALHCQRALELGIADAVFTDNALAVRDADLIVLGVPVAAIAAVAAEIGPHLTAGAIVTDVCSTKASVIRDLMPHLPAGVHFVPGHPIAGTEFSGPDAGFAEVFEERFCLLTPLVGTPDAVIARVAAMWTRCGMTVEVMDAEHHDRVLAITSHLPHLIAYTIVGTATDLGTELEEEVIRYSASGFRDFTRIAASDPVMWRDVFLNNREAVLDVLSRFNEDFARIQTAVREGDGEALFELFKRTGAIRRGIVGLRQHTAEEQKVRQGETN
ncbi:MAG: prephenate/arogenate dehydrogenase family protein [Gemmatimonadaceae bacterium]|nr:prephenate/arogenate dehydrogenase family protein [Gemmatimonadaceae bacterium]